jgi:hypothetical protein
LPFTTTAPPGRQTGPPNQVPLAVYFVIALVVILLLQYLWGRLLGVYP